MFRKPKLPDKFHENFLKEMTTKSHGPICDVCNAIVIPGQGITIGAHEMRNLVEVGFAPEKLMMFGLSKEQAIEKWKNELVEKSASPWLLCTSCYLRANEYKVNKGNHPKWCSQCGNKLINPQQFCPNCGDKL